MIHKLSYLLNSETAVFQASSETFPITKADLVKIISIGRSSYALMRCMSNLSVISTDKSIKLPAKFKTIRKMIYQGIPQEVTDALCAHPTRVSNIMRIDFMFDINGDLKIAEIDPTNKHGLGFALACRNNTEQGYGNQKILTLLSHIVRRYDELVIVISNTEKFFIREQIYFAKEFTKVTGIKTSVLTENDSGRLLEKISDPSCCFLDMPILENTLLQTKLINCFIATPKRVVMPPKHWMTNKSILAFVHDTEMRSILQAFMNGHDLDLLTSVIPPTFIEQPNDSHLYIRKEVVSSGAEGVFFSESDNAKSSVIFQKKVDQKKFHLEEKDQYVRLAAQYVGSQLGELTVTALPDLPVHGNSRAINYHVSLC